MSEELKDGIVYVMFLKGERHTLSNKYVGVTTVGLEKRLKTHKLNAKYVRTCGLHNSLLYRVMREKGIERWCVEPLAERWLAMGNDLREHEKYYIRLLKPDLNTRNGSCNDKQCKRRRERSAEPWLCEECNVTTLRGHKCRHEQTKMHRDYMWLNSLD